MTYSGRFTHISGHPSATRLVQDRGSSPAKDRRSTAVPRNQLRCNLIIIIVAYGRVMGRRIQKRLVGELPVRSVQPGKDFEFILTVKMETRHPAVSFRHL